MAASQSPARFDIVAQFDKIARNSRFSPQERAATDRNLEIKTG
jgi:hypothetical protein